LFLSHYEGLVIMPLIRGKKIISESQGEIILEVATGEYWGSLVDFVVEKGWWGIENLSLIPGKVGAAPVQNIGAYGTEFKDVFVSLDAFDTQKGEIVSFTKEECRFGYRNSIFKNKYSGRFIIINVRIKLSKIPTPNLSYKILGEVFEGRNEKEIGLAEIRDAVNEIRGSKLPDPNVLKNAGSFFKNPIIDNELSGQLQKEFPTLPVYKISHKESKLAAAWLIEQCGWKGKRFGDAGVHEKQ